MIGPDGELLGEWGSPGDGPGEFQFMAQTFSSGALASDNDGNIYVVDGVNDRIQKFDPDRAFITEWGGTGSGSGEFRVPSAAFVSGDRIYVTDAMNHRVQVFDLDGTFVTAWGTFGTEPGQINTPVAIAVMPDGTVYVAEEPTRRVQHFTADGEYLGELAQPYPGSGVVYSLAVDQAGNLWAASSLPRRVMAFALDGSLIVEFSELPDAGFLDTPGALAFDAEGNLVLTATNGEGWTYATRSDGRGRVLKLAVPSAVAPEASGSWRLQATDGMFDQPDGVAVAPDGTLWVMDVEAAALVQFSAAGDPLGTIALDETGAGQFDFSPTHRRILWRAGHRHGRKLLCARHGQLPCGQAFT